MCDHSHCGSCCEHGTTEENILSFSLYKYIDFINVECLNESVIGRGKQVFKSHEVTFLIDLLVIKG